MTRVIAEFDSFGNIIGYRPLSKEERDEAIIKLRQLLVALRENGYISITKKAVREFGEARIHNYIRGLSDYTLYETIKEIMK